MISYIFIPIDDLLEEVHVGGGERRQVGLPILEQEVVQLLLGFHLGPQLVDAYLGVRHQKSKLNHCVVPY